MEYTVFLVEGENPQLGENLGSVRQKSQLGIFSVRKNCTYGNPAYNSCSMIYAVKSVPGLADVRVLHGDGDGPRTPPRCLEGVWKKFQMTNFTMTNNSCSMKDALKPVPGLADVGVSHVDGPRTIQMFGGGLEKVSNN